ncbi:MAG: hypothetical protein LBV46_01130 [Bacteroidales bacterium]|nr:hypothetical protein [Bacteroidales bacterium]
MSKRKKTAFSYNNHSLFGWIEVTNERIVTTISTVVPIHPFSTENNHVS